MDNLVSVIVPVFNTEEYRIKACIDSILSQTWENFEILIIDDGSNTACARFLDQITARDARIYTYHNENRGVSHARNFGVEHSKGQWITFVDSDDYLAPRMIEHALMTAQMQGVSLVIGAVYITDAYFKKVEYTNNIKVEKLSHDDIEDLRKHTLDLSVKRYRNIDGGKITRGPYARMIKKEMALSHPFNESLVVGEDLLWNESILEDNISIALVREIWYFYVQHEQSVTHQCNCEMKELIRRKMELIKEDIIAGHPELQRNYDALLCEEFTVRLVRHYLLHPDNKMSFFAKKKYVKKTLGEFPYKRLCECPFYSGKTRLKIVLIRINMIIEIYWVRKILKHEN